MCVLSLLSECLCLIWRCSHFGYRLAGFRGGFIFPTFFAGTAFGHAIFRGITAIPHIAPLIGNAPPILFCMTVAVGAVAFSQSIQKPADITTMFYPAKTGGRSIH